MTAAPFVNAYADRARAEAYATLELPGSYYLAYRDLPAILARHVTGKRALDFGCGTGRSTRFLRGLDFDPVGVDTSAEMLAIARGGDPSGTYDLIPDDGTLPGLRPASIDLVLSVFTFDNIQGVDHRAKLLRALRRLLAPAGRMVLLDATPELYVHEWASFSTRPFAENAIARSGDIVRTIITDTSDHRPVEDVFWTDADYRESFARAGLEVVETLRPMGVLTDPIAWRSETTIAPWVVYVLAGS